MREARHAVQAAIAFPKPPQWQTELDQFMQQEALQGVLADPGYYSETAAKVLNTAPQHKVANLADRYFYSKIVTPWSVAVNQGHIDDKLYALLPQLRSPELQQVVQDRAECCKATMRYMLRNHIAQQSRHHHAADYAASFVQAANSSSASSTGAAANQGVSFVAVPDGEVCFVHSPDGDCQIARRTLA